MTVSGGSFALGSSTLTLTGNLTNNGSITGTGRLSMAGTASQTISGAGTITNLEINKPTGTSADKTVTITAGTGSMQTITGNLTPTAGVLATNGNLTLRSDIDGTARVGRGSDLGGYITGNVITQRYLSKTAGGSRNGRAWRLVTIPVLDTGKLSDVFMAGQPGADLTDPANRRLVDGADAFFDTNYKDGLGDAVDIAPMTNLTACSITLRQSDKRLSMEGRPWPADSAARTIPVDMRNIGDDAYVLRILPTNMSKEGFTAWLKDRHLNKETALKTDDETLYPFRRTGDLGIDSSRFEIVYRLFKPTNAGTLTPDDAAGEMAPRLYPNPAKSADVKLSLGSLAPGRYEVEVLDMSGRALWKKSIEHLSSNTVHEILQGHKLAAGQYLVRISLNDRPLHMLALIHD